MCMFNFAHYFGQVRFALGQIGRIWDIARDKLLEKLQFFLWISHCQYQSVLILGPENEACNNMTLKWRNKLE